MMMRLRFSAAILCVSSAAQAADGSLCGRQVSSISDLLIQMQSPTVEALGRDTRMFAFRDTADATYWVFSVKNTSAHPAVICAREIDEAGAKRVETGIDCKADDKICQSFTEMALAQIEKQRAGYRN
jgi:hypothetical protein